MKKKNVVLDIPNLVLLDTTHTHTHTVHVNSPAVRGDFDGSRPLCIHPSRPQPLSRCLPELCSVSKGPF